MEVSLENPMLQANSISELATKKWEGSKIIWKLNDKKIITNFSYTPVNTSQAMSQVFHRFQACNNKNNRNQIILNKFSWKNGHILERMDICDLYCQLIFFFFLWLTIWNPTVTFSYKCHNIWRWLDTSQNQVWELESLRYRKNTAIKSEIAACKTYLFPSTSTPWTRNSSA